MHKFLFVLAGASLLALTAPSVFERYREQLVDHEQEMIDPAPPVVEAAAPVTGAPGAQPAPTSGTTRLTAGPDGHFRTDARLNGRTVPVLVDTGATYVALDEATARRLGIHVAPDDFRYSVQTANGTRPVALATIDRLEVGRVAVRNVEAVVSKGDDMPVTLLGMSFLKKLKRFGVEAGTLNLVQ
ncbi:retropepsin-like aspartic protease family protein [Mangrovicella endophytica]|uniref:retropepsin-like aspartic protease family protein n=1 Tax=Mangrovicella endophytica TaxID=2066697 RepID=UPI000C9E5499|nr:TIGR02281 family clan AA aspartic protease [Mangrovicella endophytica]